MRVEQRADFLLDQVREAARGTVVPAAFQRPYVWTRDDVEALWTSLVRGWPIGSFLLWQPGEAADLTRLGRTRLGPIAASGDRWSSMILDGQNRLASIAWSLLPPEGPRPAASALSGQEAITWDASATLVADWEARAVRFVPADEASHGYRLPAGALIDTHRMHAAFRGWWKDGQVEEEPLTWFDGLGNALRSARAAVTVLRGATPAEAVEAFRHVARVGQPVGPEEVERAVMWLAAQNDEALPGLR